MFVLKRFLAFIAAGLLLVAAKYYPTDIALGKYGDVTYYDGFDRETFSGSTYSFVRADCTGGENAAESIIKDMRATIVFTEMTDCEKYIIAVRQSFRKAFACAAEKSISRLRFAAIS